MSNLRDSAAHDGDSTTNTTHAINSPHVARGTTRTLLKVVRAAQPISRADLARRLEVNRGTVTEIVKPLLSAGALRENSPEQITPARAGRPPVGLTLSARRTFFVGVSLGVLTTRVGAATPDGSLFDEETFDTPHDPAEALARVRAAVERVRAARPGWSVPFVGVSVPGPTDAGRERLLHAPHLGWRDVAVAEALRQGEGGSHAKRPRATRVIVENAANAAAVYEVRRRLRDHADGAWRDFVMVRAGTGIGVGLVLGGEVYRGTGKAGGMAGEFGHMTIVARGRMCPCGSRGCWERYASASSAATTYAGGQTPAGGDGALRFKGIVARAEAGEPRARAALGRVGEYLGLGIGNVIGGLGVARVVVSGRVVRGWKFIREPLHEALARTMAGRLTAWAVEAGEASGAELGGALEVAVEQYLTELVTRTRAA